MIDNAGIHPATSATRYFAENGIDHVYLPPYSPDLNPIENVFGVLKARYRQRGVVRNRREMESLIKDVIDEMNLDMDNEPFYWRMREFVQRVMNRQSFN